MKRRTIVLILTAFLFFYSSIFLKDIASNYLNPFDETKKEHLNKFKIGCENIMFEVFADLESILSNVTITDKTELKDVNTKLKKLDKNLTDLKKTNNLKEITICFNSYCSIAETLEYAYNKKVTYRDINEKYQNYISIFYFELEFVKSIPN